MLNYLWFAIHTTVLALLAVNKTDRVLVFHTGPLTLAIPARILATVRKIPMTIWTQDVWPDTVFAYGFKRHTVFEKLLDAFVRWLYKPCSTILVSCEGFIERIRPYAPKANIVYAPNWATLHRNETVSPLKLRNKEDDFVFMFAGNVGTVQNLEIILDAFASIEQSFPKAKLSIVGDGSALKGLRDRTTRLGLTRVQFHGRVPQADMAEFYAIADALIISLIDKPIFSLTVPAKFQSYLIAGKPMLAVIKGEVASLVEKEGLGEFANPNSVKSIEIAMIKLMQLSTEERMNIHRSSYRLFLSRFKKETVIATIETAITFRN